MEWIIKLPIENAGQNIYEIEDELTCLSHIIDQGHKLALGKAQHSPDTNKLKYVFYDIWYQTYSLQPWQYWLGMKKQIELVNSNFTNSLDEGCRSDRGRIYLMHGKPTRIHEYHDNSQTYPYEIWEYASVPNWGKAHFVFVNLTFTNNNFTQIHSNYPADSYC